MQIQKLIFSVDFFFESSARLQRPMAVSLTGGKTPPMASDVKPLISAESPDSAKISTQLPAWMKVGAVAAASALAGGLAAAWFYRKTLTRLQNAESEADNSNFRIHHGRTEDEI
jgi:hypothetical protein